LSGVDSVRETLKAAVEFGIKYLTLYAFSAENWGRPKQEIDGLMELLVTSIHGELPSMHENGVRLTTIGDVSRLPPACVDSLNEAISGTANNTNINLVLALNYSSREEILSATRTIVEQVQSNALGKEEITVATFEKALYTRGIPDPELVIRTSGEHRISNFLLWQLAYAELHFTPVFWPEFRREHLIEAIYDYQRRERRFGKTSEQIIFEK
jgi:undecaprenyl diphosphate synthase